MGRTSGSHWKHTPVTSHRCKRHIIPPWMRPEATGTHVGQRGHEPVQHVPVCLWCWKTGDESALRVVAQFDGNWCKCCSQLKEANFKILNQLSTFIYIEMRTKRAGRWLKALRDPYLVSGTEKLRNDADLIDHVIWLFCTVASADIWVFFKGTIYRCLSSKSSCN